VVELILKSLDEPFFEGIRLHTSLDQSVSVHIDRDQLTQIVLNLVRNAREAMPDGGDLFVTVEPGTPDPTTELNGPPTHAVLSVTDTGQGITEEVKERLFEPFFTTKVHGTRRKRGMGLAITYAAVKNADGLIQVDGEPGAGTTLRVCLPLCEGEGNGGHAESR
jgi:signal transduction histidine kinase